MDHGSSLSERSANLQRTHPWGMGAWTCSRIVGTSIVIKKRVLISIGVSYYSFVSSEKNQPFSPCCLRMDLVSFVPGINKTGYEAQLSTASSVIPQESEKTSCCSRCCWLDGRWSNRQPTASTRRKLASSTAHSILVATFLLVAIPLMASLCSGGRWHGAWWSGTIG